MFLAGAVVLAGMKQSWEVFSDVLESLRQLVFKCPVDFTW